MRPIFNKLLFFFILICSTFISIFLAFEVAFVLRKFFGHWHVSYSEIHFLPFLYFFLVLLVDIYRGVYIKRVPFWIDIKNSIESLFWAEILLFAFISALKIYDISRAFLMLWFFIVLLSLPIIRYIARAFLNSMGIYRDNLLILGANDMALAGASYILKEPAMGYNIVGFIDDNPSDRYIKLNGRKFRLFKGIKNFKRIARILDVGTIMIGLPDVSEDKLISLVNEIHLSSHKVLFMPGIKGLSLLNAEIIPPFMDNILLVHLRNNLMYFRNRFIKRSIDIVLSLVAILLLWPVFLIIAYLIKRSSEGPVIYKQRRIGYGGKVFFVYKFRTMYKDADDRLKEILKNDPEKARQWQETHKLSDDPRITPLGRILRRTSLDELPQLFNVFKGDMALVGPRPVTQDEIDRHYKKDAAYYFMVRPGITGLWQVSGRSDTDYKFRIETDVWYVLNWSLWLDLMILAKTIWVVIRGKGAY